MLGTGGLRNLCYIEGHRDVMPSQGLQLQEPSPPGSHQLQNCQNQAPGGGAVGQQEPGFPALAGAGGELTAVGLRSLEGCPMDCVLRSPRQRLQTQHPEKGSMERAQELGNLCL